MYYIPGVTKPARPTPAEKREAARRRAGKRGITNTGDLASSDYGQPVGATLFESGPRTPRSTGEARTHTLGPIRLTLDLAERLAAYGNERSLNQSDTVRELLARALGHWQRERRRRK
jgi:hypothetical protein